MTLSEYSLSPDQSPVYSTVPPFLPLLQPLPIPTVSWCHSHHVTVLGLRCWLIGHITIDRELVTYSSIPGSTRYCALAATDELPREG